MAEAAVVWRDGELGKGLDRYSKKGKKLRQW